MPENRGAATTKNGDTVTKCGYGCTCHPDWATPAVLRERVDAERITCQAVVSGRWKPLADPYWNDCVIPVRFRIAA